MFTTDCDLRIEAAILKDRLALIRREVRRLRGRLAELKLKNAPCLAKAAH
jgi:hypothetical protein